MNFFQWSFETLDLFKFNSAVATNVGQWTPCLGQKTCALLDPIDDGGGGGNSGKEECKGRLIETEGQEPVEGQMVSVIDP